MRIQTGTNLLGTDDEDGFPLIKMGNIQRGYFNLDKLQRIKISENIEKDNIIQFGDFLFNTRNTLDLVGKGATWFGKSNKFGFNNNIAKFTFKNLNTVFFNYLYNTPIMINKIHSRAAGTTSVAAIYPKDLEGIIIITPTIDEQIRIGKFFKKIDSIVLLYQHQLDQLEKLKKGLLQKLFPQDGQKAPYVRFADFHGDWEQHKFSDITSERVQKSNTGHLLSITINNGIQLASSLNRKDSSSKNKNNYKVVTKGDIAYNSMRMWQGASGLSDFDGIISPAYTVVIPNENKISGIFMSYLLKKSDMTWKFRINSQGLTSDTWNLKYPSFSKIIVLTPNGLIEQRKIEKLLLALDKTINLYQKKLKDLKKMKQYFLQKLFI